MTAMEGSPDIGGSRASMALMAAETLGVPYEQIKAHVGDTESTGFCNVTGGSRTTFATGMAVVQACEDIIAQRGQPGHLVERLVDLRQQPDVRRRVPARERPARPPPRRSRIEPVCRHCRTRRSICWREMPVAATRKRSTTPLSRLPRPR